METSASETDDETSDVIDDDTHRRDMDKRYDPWEGVIQKAFEKCDDKYQEEMEKLMKRKKLSRSDAGRRVYQDMGSAYRKAVMSIFMNRMTWFDAMRKDQIYKAIKKTATNLIELDDYEPEEAWKSAVAQRKYLLDKLLEDYEPSDLASESVDERDQESEDSESDDAVEQEGGGNDDDEEETLPVNRQKVRPNVVF